jgi:putative two-component system response regulator
MEPTITLSNNQILLVEDNENVRKAITKILQIENYHVLQAQNGKEALSVLRSFSPDLILSDVKMPQMGGIELFSHVRENLRLRAIPFIFLIANTREDFANTVRELGVEDWISKPIDADSLIRTINSRLLRAAEVKIAHIDQAYLETIEVLANAVEGRDRYTRGHIERVTTYVLWMAEELRWPSENIRVLQFGARLHDIGKIIVPDQILNKPGPLDENEWNLMKKHPTAGARILQKISHLEEAIPYILYHHEKWNGEGYPAGLSGKETPLGARVLALADVFDAMTTGRPYRPPIPRETALEHIINQSGIHFDPDLVPNFVEVIKQRSQEKNVGQLSRK